MRLVAEVPREVTNLFYPRKPSVRIFMKDQKSDIIAIMIIIGGRMG